jgi:hypothetical protein
MDEQSLAEHSGETEPQPDLATPARTLAKGGFRSGRTDTAIRSREILETEYDE